MKSSFSVTRNLIIEITPARFNRSKISIRPIHGKWNNWEGLW